MANEKNQIVSQMGELKDITNDFISKLIDVYGSPDEDEQPALMIEHNEIVTYCFGVEFNVDKIFKANNGNVIYRINNEDEADYNVDCTDIPLENLLDISFKLNDMFNKNEQRVTDK